MYVIWGFCIDQNCFLWKPMVLKKQYNKISIVGQCVLNYVFISMQFELYIELYRWYEMVYQHNKNNM